jgi:hypothetical protein
MCTTEISVTAMAPTPCVFKLWVLRPATGTVSVNLSNLLGIHGHQRTTVFDILSNYFCDF